MAISKLQYISASGQISYIGMVQRLSDGYFSQSGSPTFSNSLTFLQKQINLPEASGLPGLYTNTVDITSWVNDEYSFLVCDSGVQNVLAGSNFWVKDGIEAGPSGNANIVWNAYMPSFLGNNTFGSGINNLNQDIYFADIKLVNNAAVPNNEWSVTWWRNNQVVTSGSVTNAALSVYNTSTGNPLFSNKAMSWSGPSLSALNYIESTNMAASGVNYLVAASGTIYGATRGWYGIKAIDSL